VLQATYNSSQRELEVLEEAALEACQSVDEGARQAGSSVASRHRALGSHVRGVCVTSSFKGKTECIDHVRARIKLHTRLDIMNTKNSATRRKSYYKP
jgi:hypothetical protein